MKAQAQKYLAELFGTFILVFVGSASIIALLKAGFVQGYRGLVMRKPRAGAMIA